MRLVADYFPHNWVVLKIHNEDETLYKVLAGWSGGYLNGDSWRLNSGITRAVEEDRSWGFYGSSGSGSFITCYDCPKGTYGLTWATSGAYNELKERFEDKVELMPEDTNWNEVVW